MFKYIFLDSPPLGLLTSPKVKSSAQEYLSIQKWALDCTSAGHQILIPEIVDYEIRRELLRAKKLRSVSLLNSLRIDFTFIPLTSTAMLKAADLWAESRQRGQHTGHAENIDVDVILAAQVLTCGLPADETVIATSNLRHLTQFVHAELWQNIA